ncbi:MAG: hypothetical protein HND55_12405 [Pseudomonadota bacterium]|nr:MAG: hypothetical protein HND55_12405 [Pseudomonadota bacterium]
MPLNHSIKLLACAACLGLFATARADSTLLGSTWVVEICRSNITGARCQSTQDLVPPDRFSVDLNQHGDLVLSIHKQNPPVFLQFPLREISLCQRSGQCQFPQLTASFEDFDGMKNLHLVLLRHAGQSGDPASTCASWFSESAAPNKLEEAEIKAQCTLDRLVYWSIQTINPDADDGRIMSPPGDGHGTGSDGEG